MLSKSSIIQEQSLGMAGLRQAVHYTTWNNPELGIMPQVVNAWAGVLLVNYAALLEELAKGVMHYAVAQATPPQINEQGGVW